MLDDKIFPPFEELLKASKAVLKDYCYDRTGAPAKDQPLMLALEKAIAKAEGK